MQKFEFLTVDKKTIFKNKFRMLYYNLFLVTIPFQIFKIVKNYVNVYLVDFVC